MPGVLQEWLSELPLREQGVLVLALRGPDGVRKEGGAKNLVRALRGCIMITGATGKPLLPGENMPEDNFMEMYRVGHPNEEPWAEASREFFREWDTYNVHWLLHFLHAAEILGYRHPDERIRQRWRSLYFRSAMAKCHMGVESKDVMMDRLKDGHKPDTPE